MDHTGELSIYQILDGGNSTSYLLCQSFRSPESVSDPLGLYPASSQGCLIFWLASCRIWFRFCWCYVSSNILHVIFVFFQGFSNAMIWGSGERQSDVHTCTAQKYQTLLTHPLREALKKKKRGGDKLLFLGNLLWTIWEIFCLLLRRSPWDQISVATSSEQSLV